MSRAVFRPLPVADLLDGQHLFVIPSYQRGFRWERKQVEDLLNDIYEFSTHSSKSGDSYYLQPIVVRPCMYGDDNTPAYEVLDGQQRLTTLMLILNRLKRRLGEDDQEILEGLYRIEYANRPRLDYNNLNPSESIDSYYLSEAKVVIDHWFNEAKQRKVNLDPFKASLIYKGPDQPKVKFIWYQIDDSSVDLVGIKLFNRLNKGKIALTNSELIKALFILDYDTRCCADSLEGVSTVGGVDERTSDQFVMEWNEMERRFQDDDFWYFISDDTDEIQTRMDVLFDFVTQKKDNEDPDYPYRVIQGLYDYCHRPHRAEDDKYEGPLSGEVQSMQDAWKYIRRTFDRLVAWYEDNLYYHYVGYLVATGSTALEVYNALDEAKNNHSDPAHEWTLKDTIRVLRTLIMRGYDRNKRDNPDYLSKDQIDELEYGVDDRFIFNLLLLFNIESCRRSENMRFSFKKFKQECWDIEHVEAQNDATIQDAEARIQWLKNVHFILGREQRQDPGDLRDSVKDRSQRDRELNDLRNRVNDLIESSEKNDHTVDKKKYQEVYHDVIQHYAPLSTAREKDKDQTRTRKDYLSNLTLLDSRTNRSYKDAPFAYKRYCIIENDKEGRCFIPLCTRNLFLKYYTQSDHSSSYLDTLRWNQEDREGYIESIRNILAPIFDSVNDRPISKGTNE